MTCTAEGCTRQTRTATSEICHTHYQRRYRSHTLISPWEDIDPIVVDRLVAGERIPFTHGERVQAVHRLFAQGVPKKAIARQIGVHHRQVYRDLERVTA